MQRIFNNLTARTFFISTYLCTSTLTIPSLEAIKIEINDVNAALKAKKLIDKVSKFYKKKSKDTDKLFGYLYEISDLVYDCTGQKINLDDQFKFVEHNLNKNKVHYSNSDMKAIKEKVKKFGKKHKHRKEFKALCVAADIEFDMDLADQLFIAKHNSEKESDQEIDLPMQMIIGITLALAGGFLSMIPIPICQTASAHCIGWGMGMAIQSYADKAEEKKQNEKRKNG